MYQGTEAYNYITFLFKSNKGLSFPPKYVCVCVCVCVCVRARAENVFENMYIETPGKYPGSPFYAAFPQKPRNTPASELLNSFLDSVRDLHLLEQDPQLPGRGPLIRSAAALRNKVNNKHNGLESSPNHPPPRLGPWKNCLSQNESLVPQSLGASALEFLGGTPRATAENGERAAENRTMIPPNPCLT